ncbi:MAG TPA: heavy metal-associated domain-containing protein [Steroidobacteraceae bacterium]|nr:heavy metal-associated domain-containing protein [Steroidobacteraceae bacterium]
MTLQSSDKAAGSVVLAISGMTCGGCANAVSRALSQVPGVAEARVDLAAGRAAVTGTARPEDLIRAVEAAGFAGGLA